MTTAVDYVFDEEHPFGHLNREEHDCMKAGHPGPYILGTAATFKGKLCRKCYAELQKKNDEWWNPMKPGDSSVGYNRR